MIPFCILYSTYCSVYIMAASTQDISEIQQSSKFDYAARVTACKGRALSPRLTRSVDGHKLRLCWSFDYTPTRSLFFGGLLRDAESTQRSFRRKRSTKLSFTQFAADFVQQPCQASARGCRRVGRDVQVGTSTRLMCAKLSCPQTWQCTKLFLSCSANRKKKHFTDVLSFLKYARETLI